MCQILVGALVAGASYVAPPERAAVRALIGGLRQSPEAVDAWIGDVGRRFPVIANRRRDGILPVMTTPVRSVAELTAALDRGEQVKYLFFWGHQPSPDGQITASCLSQWWPSPFTLDGREYATAEHYMMWRKAMLFGDEAAAQQILDAPDPHAAKKLGGRVAGFDDQVWQEHRFAVVVAGNMAKFGQHPDLSEFLTGTGGRVIVEASPLDRIWGIGLTRDDPAATDPAHWRGRNLLGFALMQVRDTLSEG